MGNGGEANLGNERSSRPSSNKSKRRSKKAPKRGMGVAALEKLRLQTEYGNSNVPSPQGPLYLNPRQEPMRIQETYSSPSFSSLSTNRFPGYFERLLMGIEELGSGNISYGGSQFNTRKSLIPGNGMLQSQQFTEPNMTRQFMNLPVEMGMRELERGNISYGGSQFSTTSLIPGNGMLQSQQFTKPNMTRNFMKLLVENQQKKQKMDNNDSVGGSISQNFGTSYAHEELDLELKL